MSLPHCFYCFLTKKHWQVISRKNIESWYVLGWEELQRSSSTTIQWLYNGQGHLSLDQVFKVSSNLTLNISRNGYPQLPWATCSGVQPNCIVEMFKPSDHFHGPLWTHLNRPMSFLHWGPQSQVQFSTHSHKIRVEWHNHLPWPAGHVFFMQPKIQLTFSAASAQIFLL